MSRWRAFGIHFLLSTGIFSLFLILTYFVWYPRPLFDAINTFNLLKILTGVDVVLGPLLTLIVFKSGKKGLKADLATIASLQITALAYGVYVVLSARPAFVVFSVDRFEVLTVGDAVVEPKAVSPFIDAGWWGPKFASVKLPSGDEAMQISFEAFGGGRDVGQRQQYYQDYSLAINEIRGASKPLSYLLGLESDTDEIINTFLSDNGGTADSWLFVPMVVRNREMAAILDQKSLKPIYVLHVYPWRTK